MHYHFFNPDPEEAEAFRGAAAIYNQKELIWSETPKRRGLGSDPAGREKAHVERVLGFTGYPSVPCPWGQQSGVRMLLTYPASERPSQVQ